VKEIYNNKAWRKNHPRISALYDRVCPGGYAGDWKGVATQVNGTWYILSRGYTTEDDFLLIWGDEYQAESCQDLIQQALKDITRPGFQDWDHKNWEHEANLPQLLAEVRDQRDVDLLAVPIEAWQVEE
jgi:hypothetical protein